DPAREVDRLDVARQDAAALLGQLLAVPLVLAEGVGLGVRAGPGQEGLHDVGDARPRRFGGLVPGGHQLVELAVRLLLIGRQLDAFAAQIDIPAVTFVPIPGLRRATALASGLKVAVQNAVQNPWKSYAVMESM